MPIIFGGGLGGAGGGGGGIAFRTPLRHLQRRYPN